MAYVPVWKRSFAKPARANRRGKEAARTRAPARTATAIYLAFHDGPLAEGIPFVAEELGAPSLHAMASLRLAQLDPIGSPDTFRLARQGGARWLAERDLGTRLVARLGRARFATRIAVQVPDPPDLGHLQAARACLRWLCARGVSIVQDVVAGRWFSAEQLLDEPPNQPFDIRREVRILFDGDQKANGGRVLNTRGMMKFARPDLVAVTRKALREPMEALMYRLAHTLALGFLPEPPRHGVDVRPGQSVYLHAAHPSDALVASLDLGNDAVVLRTEAGDHLTTACPSLASTDPPSSSRSRPRTRSVARSKKPGSRRIRSRP